MSVHPKHFPSYHLDEPYARDLQAQGACALRFFVMPLAQNMPICNKTLHPPQALECLKLSTAVKLLQWKARVGCDFFLLQIVKFRAMGITKNAPNLEVVR